MKMFDALVDTFPEECVPWQGVVERVSFDLID